MNGYLDNVGPGGFATVDFLNITYANYDVYVYFGADQNGRSGAIESATAGQTFSYSTFSQFSAEDYSLLLMPGPRIKDQETP